MLPGVEVVEFGGYGDEDGMREAFAGVSALFFCSAKEAEDRVAQHRSVVDAAVEAGVGRIVYLSFVGASPEATFTFARDHYDTEQYIRSSGIPFTFSRQSLYADFLPLLGGEDGVIRGPAGDGRLAPVLRDDVADVLANVLVQSGHVGVTYTLTGPETHTLAEIADLVTTLTGQRVTFENETLEQAYASRAVYGAPAWEVEGWVTTYTAIAAGEWDIVTDDVRRVAGHDPVSAQQFLESLE
jgi:uncharacterized protein YbjT (DUF2867 family)